MCDAGGVLVVLSLLLVARAQRRRDSVTHVILGGAEGLRVAIVQRQRRRLLSQRHLVGVARSLEEMAHQAAAPKTGPVRLVPPLFEPRVVVQVADELIELGALLRAGRVSARGVAYLERLVSHSTSPLYGRHASVLYDELDRAQQLLKEPAE